MSTDSPRIPSFAAFWPYYIGEHRHPVCRRLHFVGTTLFGGIVLGCLTSRPLWFGGALLAALALGAVAFKMEGKRSGTLVLISMIVLLIVGHPAILVGVVAAYAFAWIGHFKVEHNRPATFTYPLWSLAGRDAARAVVVRGRLGDRGPRPRGLTRGHVTPRVPGPRPAGAGPAAPSRSRAGGG